MLLFFGRIFKGLPQTFLLAVGFFVIAYFREERFLRLVLLLLFRDVVVVVVYIVLGLGVSYLLVLLQTFFYPFFVDLSGFLCVLQEVKYAGFFRFQLFFFLVLFPTHYLDIFQVLYNLYCPLVFCKRFDLLHRVYSCRSYWGIKEFFPLKVRNDVFLGNFMILFEFCQGFDQITINLELILYFLKIPISLQRLQNKIVVPEG